MTGRVGAVSLSRLLPDGWRAAAPAYVALADAIQLLVLDGRLPLDVRVPSERELAAALGLSRTTVTTAYERLRADGFLVSRQGAGSWTATPAGARSGPPPVPLIRPAAPGELDDGTVDLAAAALPAGPEVPAAYTAGLAELPRHLPGIGYDTLGLPVLRDAVAGWFTARGVPTTPDDVVVTGGTLHAATLVLDALVEPGDRVLVEHPTYPNALEAVRRLGGRPVPVAVAGDGAGADGWDLDAVEASLRQAAPVAGYVVPDFHNPTGACLSAAGRARLVEAAAATRTTLVVDESLTDLWFDGPPPVSLGTLGSLDRVVCIGGLSKSFWGGLRVGWVRAERSLLRRIAATRAATDVGNPVVEQLAATHLLTDRHAATSLARRRAELRRVRATVETALRRHVPGWRWRRPAGGLSLWARLDAPVSSAMSAVAARHGLRLAPGPLFGVDGAFDRYLRVPLLPGPTGAEEVARRLAAVQADVLASAPSATWDSLPVA